MFGHTGGFAVPPMYLPNHVVDPQGPARRALSPKIAITPAPAPPPPPPPSNLLTKRSRKRTLPFDMKEEMALRSLRASQNLPKAASSNMADDNLLDILKSLIAQCNTEELRIQTLEGTIRHKISEYPTVITRLDELDANAIDLYDSLMDSQTVPVDTSPSFRPFDLPSPLSIDGESDIDGFMQSKPVETSRPAAVHPSPSALLKEFTTHLEKAEAEVNASKANMLEREEKLKKAAAVLGRDEDIIAELERRIAQRKKDITAIRARQQMQNIAMLIAAIVASIVVCMTAVWLSLKQTDRASTGKGTE